MKYFLILAILLVPFSTVYGYEKYETIPDFYLDSDPTICYSTYEMYDRYENNIKTAINNWNTELKNYTNNYEVWNVDYWFLDENKISPEELDSTPCDTILVFTSSLTESLGNTSTLDTGESFIEISTVFDSTDEQIISTITHELGHIFGLGHYVTDEDGLLEKWEQGIDVPSIMIEYSVSENIKQITELDLEKIVSIYGTDGFEKNRIVQDWIKDTASWWAQGLISNDEYLDSIQYLIEEGIIQV